MGKIYLRPFAISMVIIILMLQVILEDYIGIIKYFDEAVAVFGVLYIVFDVNEKKDKYIVCCIAIIICTSLLGVVGNIVYQVQKDWNAIFMDLGNMFKGYIIFLAAYNYFGKDEIKKNIFYILKYLNFFSRVILLPGVILSFFNLATDINMHTDYVYGIRSFHYIFGRVGNLNCICVQMLIIMTMYLHFLTKKELIKQKIFITMSLFLMITTLRTRAIVAVILYVICYYYFIKRRKINIRLRYVVPTLGIMLWVSWPKIEYYFLQSTVRARSVLLRYGIETAKTFFPLGAGFGSYGTYAAKIYWSRLYDEYNFYKYYGLSRDFGAFLTDNYWPAVLGEFGFWGMILIFLLIFLIFRIILQQTNGNGMYRCAAVFGMLYMCMGSVVTGSFFQSTAVCFMMLIAFAVAGANDEKSK